MRTSIILSLLFGLSLSSMASDKAHLYSAVGHGVQSCGTFLLDRENKNNEREYWAWFGGFLTGHNLRTAETYDILGSTDFNGAMLWVVNYCQANPLKSFVDAAEALTFELTPRRTRKAPKE